MSFVLDFWYYLLIEATLQLIIYKFVGRTQFSVWGRIVISLRYEYSALSKAEN